MKRLIKQGLEKLLPKLLQISLSGTNPLLEFNSWETIRINQRRLEHLATLNLPVSNRTVLELGAGIGNLTHFFLDRGCKLTTTEGRAENLKVLAARYTNVGARRLDLDNPDFNFPSPFDIVFCYGLLYHLQRPAEALKYMARHCGHLLLLESCVSFGDGEAVNLCSEDKAVVSQAVSGTGCRPTRKWIFKALQEHFEFVYLTRTQPCHEQFPTDWSSPSAHTAPYSRSVFVGSRVKLDNPLLVQELLAHQDRH